MPNNPIFLQDIWPINNETDYKVHFARRNTDNEYGEPLNVWVRDPSEWQGWQQYYPGRDDFNRTFIFSLMKFYHEEDTWLFGGVFRVKGLYKDENNDHYYEVERTPTLEAFIGRLKLHSPYRERTTRVNFENHYAN
ncbi:MAG: GIY-YIG nuclease family protein, partial [Candidatus Poribacteria bacterium]|nr:GIY-YIG nuclease family protein [Candidatus Poribacteria bacterium]